MRAARDAANLAEMDEPRYRVLCLPGGLGTAAFYDDILAAPSLAAGGVRAIAVTLPGFGGVPFPAGFDATLEAYGRGTRRQGSRDPCQPPTTSRPTAGPST